MGLLDFLLQPKIGQPKTDQMATARRNLTNREAVIGGQLFGTVPANRSRSFFCLEPGVWVWLESWRDLQGKDVLVTTRYEIQAGRIVKIQDGQPYQLTGALEARNLLGAARLYLRRVRNEVYGLTS